MKKCILIFILLLISLGSWAQFGKGTTINEKDIAFGDGEKLSYNAKYSAAMFTTSVADVDFITVVENNLYKITVVGRTRPFYSVFFDLEDQYQCWLDKQTLRPIRLTARIKEGSYRYRSSFDYNWRTKMVRSFGQNLKSGNTRNKTMTLTDNSFDPVALFFNMRNIDITNMTHGKNYQLELLLKDTIRVINYRLVGREEITVDDLGTFKSLKVVCQIATDDTDALKDGSEFFIWLSDDKNRIPIYLESPIRVGSIKVSLSSYSNLKHPPTSHIKKK